MKWEDKNIQSDWTKDKTNEAEKLKIAIKVASFVKDGDVIGFGSGSTSLIAVKEIAKRVKSENLNITAIPTSEKIKKECESLGIKCENIGKLRLNWGFDGADEVDLSGRLIKGRGGEMYREKMVMSSSPKTYILVDSSKFVKNLCDNYPIPVECVPNKLSAVKENLIKLGAKDMRLRMDKLDDSKPAITENGNYIIDCEFESVPDSLEKNIKEIEGVLESGLFIGYNIEIITSK